jgi:hypothetical protein
MNFLRANPSSAPTSSPQANSDSPWLISTGAKAVATVAGLFAIVSGFLNLLSIFDTSCMFAGGLLIVEGLMMCLLEAPCFCTFLDFAYIPSNYVDGKPHWMKATLYLFFAAIPFFSCIGFTTFLSCGLIFVSCALYLMMALGKKASLDEMRVKVNNLSEKPSAVLVNNEELPKGTDPPPTYKQSESLTNVYIPPPNTISGGQTPLY